MKGIYIGLLCLCYSLFLLFISPKEKKNMFGYKSLQQGMHKEVWRWTNQCFGFLTMIGSIVYLTVSIVLQLKGISYSTSLTKYGAIYIVISFVLTECYTIIQRVRNKN